MFTSDNDNGDLDDTKQVSKRNETYSVDLNELDELYHLDDLDNLDNFDELKDEMNNSNIRNFIQGSDENKLHISRDLISRNSNNYNSIIEYRNNIIQNIKNKCSNRENVNIDEIISIILGTEYNKNNFNVQNSPVEQKKAKYRDLRVKTKRLSETHSKLLRMQNQKKRLEKSQKRKEKSSKNSKTKHKNFNKYMYKPKAKAKTPTAKTRRKTFTFEKPKTPTPNSGKSGFVYRYNANNTIYRTRAPSNPSTPKSDSKSNSKKSNKSSKNNRNSKIIGKNKNDSKSTENVKYKRRHTRI